MLSDLLAARRESILKRWHQSILEGYPADTAGFMHREKDRFLNPVGHAISGEIGPIFDETVKGASSEKLSSSLNNLLKIRAVQDFTPSQAAAFVFLLKKAIREELEPELRQQGLAAELLEFESRIDGVALLAFDLYVACHEKIYEIRIKEISNRSARVLERLNRIYGTRDLEEELEDPEFGSRKAR